MTITFSQVQIGQLADQQFERRLVGVLAQSDPQATEAFATPDGMNELRQQCIKARTYGLESELDIAKYVLSAWLLGQDFDVRFPAIQEFLRTDRLGPSQKAEAIERITLSILAELNEGRAK